MNCLRSVQKTLGIPGFSFFILLIFFPLLSGAETLFPVERRVITDSYKPGSGKKIRVAFFDADSTLRVAPSGAPSANSATDVAILPLLTEPLKLLNHQNYLIAIVSNQKGIADGYISYKDSQDALVLCMKKLSKSGTPFHYFDFAEKADENRKPEIGMALRLAEAIREKFKKEVDWDGSIMVGDSAWKKGIDTEPDGTPGEDFSNTDRLFAENIQKKLGKLTFYHPRQYFGWTKFGIRNFTDYKSLQDFIKKYPDLNPEPKP